MAVQTGDEELGVESWRRAYDAGVYVNAVAYPAVPRGKSVLRLAVMATHTAEQIGYAAEVIAAAVRAAGVEELPAVA